jgi:toxin YoeB
MNKLFTDEAWKDYQYWVETDKKQLKKINALIKDIDRNPCEGIGKPEPLKANLSGYRSRRIDLEHRVRWKRAGSSLFLYGFITMASKNRS